MKSTRKHTRTRARKPGTKRPPEPVAAPVSQEDEPWQIKDYGGFRVAYDKKGKLASGGTQLLLNADKFGQVLQQMRMNREIQRMQLAAEAQAKRDQSLLHRSLRVFKRVLHEATA